MTQQRLHVAFAITHEAAVKIRDEWQEKDKTTKFQIRRRRNNFEIIGRVSAETSIATSQRLNGAFKTRKKPRAIYKTEKGVDNPITYNNVQKRKDHKGRWTQTLPDKFSPKEILEQQLEEVAQERERLRKVEEN